MEKCITTCTIFYVILITHMFVYGYTLINSSDLKKLDSLLSDEQRAICIVQKKKGKDYIIFIWDWAQVHY